MSGTDAASRLALLLVVEPVQAHRAKRLLASVARFNTEALPVLVVEGDVDRETIAFAETTLFDLFLVLTADAVFVRPFGLRDFADEDGSAFVFLTEDRDRRASGAVHARGRLVAGGPMVYESSAVRGLVAAGPLDGTAAEAYARWLVRARGTQLRWREPVFLELDGLPVGFSLSTATSDDIARGYVGYVGDLPSDNDALASVPPIELMKAAAWRVYGKAPRLKRLIERAAGR